MFEADEDSLQNSERYLDMDLKIAHGVGSQKLNKRDLRSQDTSLNNSEADEDDLREFMTHKIQEIKQRMK